MCLLLCRLVVLSVFSMNLGVKVLKVVLMFCFFIGL